MITDHLNVGENAIIFTNNLLLVINFVMTEFIIKQ